MISRLLLLGLCVGLNCLLCDRAISQDQKPPKPDEQVEEKDVGRLESSPIEIGTRRELFVDHFLIDHLDNANLRLHQPQAAQGRLPFDKPWEGAFAGYATIIKDGDIFRMYYRGLPVSGRDGTDTEVTCYAVSLDGIHWTKPNLQIHDIGGSRDNNIIMMGHTPASHNFAPFLDTNPNAKLDQRYKALGGLSSGLIAFTSADGIHWTRLQEEPVFTKGRFDSQNVSFWSASEQQYLCYFRTSSDGFRAISRTTSKDFVNWSEPVAMSFGETPREHLYTNQTHPYFRAPHLYVAIAARFIPGRRVLSAAEARQINVDPKYFGDCSDSVFMSSRGGIQYDRTFMESFIRPGVGLENWVSRTNYPALGVVPTGPSEMSMYMSRNYGQPTAYLQRYVLRTDGFASIHAGYDGGEVVTKPVTFPEAAESELVSKRKVWQKLVEEESKSISPMITSDAAIVGNQSLAISRPIVLELPGTKEMGKQITLAAYLRSIPAGHRRLFSAYNGGSTTPNELCLDFDSGGNINEDGAIRFFYDDFNLNVDIEEIGVWSAESGDSEPHHIALTWDDGLAKLFFDGKLVAESRRVNLQENDQQENDRGGNRDSENRITRQSDQRPDHQQGDNLGTISLQLGNLRFGEDIPPTSLSNEPFLGIVDDMLVLRRALTDAQIQRIAEAGALELLSDGADLEASDGNFLFTMEAEPKQHTLTEQPIERSLTNSFSQQGVSLTTLPGIEFVRRELTLNMATSAAGSIRVEIQDELGNPLQGFSLADSDELIGDLIDRTVTWRGGSSDISKLAGQPIRFRFEIKDADIYSMRIK